MPLILPAGHGNRSFFVNGSMSLHSANADAGNFAMVKDLINNGRIKDAYDLTIKVKSFDGENSKNFDLLKTSKTVFENFQSKFPTDVDEIFFSKYSECLRSLIICHLLTKNTNDAAEILFQFDSLLFQANEYKCQKSWWMNFLQFFETDLLTFCADLILLHLKKGKTAEFKKSCRLAVYCYANCLKYDFSKSSKSVSWRKNSIFNQIQAHQMFFEFKTTVGADEWNKILDYLMSNQINKELVQYLFPLKLTKGPSKSFVASNLQPILASQIRGLTDDVLNEYFYEILRSSDGLDRSIWFLTNYWDDAGLVLSRTDGIEHLFEKSLNFTSSDLTSMGVHSLCQLDLKIFLHLSVHCAFLRNEKSSATNLRRYSFRITDYFSGSWQKNFWHACITLVAEGGNSDLRITVSDGLDVLRLKNKNSPPFRLIYGVALMLDDLANERKTSSGDDWQGISDYSAIYWRYLEQFLISGRDVSPKYDSPFFVPCTPLSEIQKQTILDWKKRSSDVDKIRLDSSFLDKSYSTAKDLTSPPIASASFISAASSMPSAQDPAVLQLYETMMKSVMEQNKTLGDTCRALTDQLQTLTLTNKQLIDQMNDMRLENKTILSTSSVGDHSKPAPGSWECNICYHRNDVGTTSCIVCNSNKGGLSVKSASGFSMAPKPQQQQPATSTPTSILQPVSFIPSSVSAPASDFSFGGTAFGSVSSAQQPTFAQVAQQAAKPADKKVEPFKGFVGAGQPLFGNFAAKPVDRPRRTTSESQDDHDGAHDESFEPTTDFKPLIPLPALVEVKTGEENEDILLKERAKLYRFDNETNEFKERGLGELKILRNKLTGRMRILMRRDQVLKLCANHYLTADMKLLPMAKSEQAFTWQCQDFSEEELKVETLAAKFKTPELAKKFKTVFEECVEKIPKENITNVAADSKDSTSTGLKPKETEKAPIGFGDKFKPALGSWECSACLVRNDAGAASCVACKTNKGGPPVTSASGFSFAPTKQQEQPAVSTPASIFQPASVNVPAPADKISFGFGGSTFGSVATAQQSTFAQVAQQAAKPEDKKVEPFKGFVGAGQQLFGNLAAKPVEQTRRTISESHSDAEGSGAHNESFEPTIDFKPLIPLPALVEVKTGEENEDILFKERAKIYRFVNETNEFKERGLGELKILRNRTTGRMRILMRRDQVLKLCANHYLTADMKLLPMAKSEQAFTWQCQDFSEEELKVETLAAKFKTPELAKKFKTVFEECVSKLPKESVSKNAAADENDSKLTDVKTKEDERAPIGFGDRFKPALGSWECTVCFVRNDAGASSCVACKTNKGGPAVTSASNFLFALTKPQEQSATATSSSVFKPVTSTPVPASTVSFGFAGSTFGSMANAQQPTFAQIAQQAAKPVDNKAEPFKGFIGAGQQLFGNNAAKPVERPRRTTSESQDDHDGSGAHDESFEPTTDFKPLIPLPALVEVKTGEENEEILFKERAKLFRFVNETHEFKERGLGELKILRNRTTGRMRILMRRDQVLKLCANHYLTSDMQLLPMAKSEQAFTWQCQDFSEEELKVETLAAKFKNPDLAKKFKAIFEECIAKIPKENIKGADSKSTDIKPKEVEKAPLGFGDRFKPAAGSWECGVCFVRNDAGASSCVACKTNKAGPAKISASSFSFLPAIQQELPVSCTPSSIFQPASSTVFGSPALAPKTVFGFGGSTFGSLANAQQPTFAQIAQQAAKPADHKVEPFKGFVGAGQPLFGNLASKPVEQTRRTTSESHDDHDGSGAHDEPFEPTTDFKPLIPLPALVEVKTGEENEDILFRERAKLYRYVNETNEFKERGLGELKILRNKTTGRLRILMRRDQVLKLCANHYLTSDMQLLPMAKSEQAFTWQCQDFSDGEVKCETLAAKFKNPELAKKFKAVFEECVSNLTKENVSTVENVPTVAAADSKSIDVKPKELEKASVGFGDRFKPALGSWECNVCFVRNDAGATSCNACKSSKNDTSSKLLPKSSSDDDLQIIYVAQSSPEQKALADKFKLPPNFYLYESKPSCPGCTGCKNDDELDALFKQIDRRASSGASGSLTGDDTNGDDASSEEGKILFTKNATLSTREGGVYKPLGVGEILVVYDDDVDAYRCKFHNDESAAVLMDHLIAQPSNLTTAAGKKGQFIAEWTAPDWAGSHSSSTRKTFQLKFSSALALKEFADLFKQGLEIARKNSIFYETQSDFHLYPSSTPGDKQSLVCEGLLRKMMSHTPEKSKNGDKNDKKATEE